MYKFNVKSMLGRQYICECEPELKTLLHKLHSLTS